MSSSEPSLAHLVEEAIENRLSSVHTMLPGRVVKVDVPAGKCDVQPILKAKYGDETVIELPVIPNVPIQVYRAGTAFISLPVKVGDLVELRWSQRSLDVWKSKGGLVDPLDPRKFHYADCVAYPGMYPFNSPPTGASADDIVIQNSDNSKITIKPGGEIQLSGSSSIKLLANLIHLSGDGDAIALASKVLTELENIKSAYDTHTHLYSPGPGGPTPTDVPAVPMTAPQSVASTKVKAE